MGMVVGLCAWFCMAAGVETGCFNQVQNTESDSANRAWVGKQEKWLKLSARRAWFASDGWGRTAFSLGRPPPSVGFWPGKSECQDLAPRTSIMESSKAAYTVRILCPGRNSISGRPLSVLLSGTLPAGGHHRSQFHQSHGTLLSPSDLSVLVSSAAWFDKATRSKTGMQAVGTGTGWLQPEHKSPCPNSDAWILDLIRESCSARNDLTSRRRAELLQRVVGQRVQLQVSGVWTQPRHSFSLSSW